MAGGLVLVLDLVLVLVLDLLVLLAVVDRGKTGGVVVVVVSGLHDERPGLGLTGEVGGPGCAGDVDGGLGLAVDGLAVGNLALGGLALGGLAVSLSLFVYVLF